MENFKIDKFDPLKKEITDLVESVKKTVASSTGAEGYDLMKENKKALQSRRIAIVKDMKSDRDGALQFQRAIIQIEKELLGIIKPVEDDLLGKIKEIDEAKAREERKELLPDRKLMLADIKIELSDDAILYMDDNAFASYHYDKKMEYLEAKQAKIDEAEQKKIDDDKKNKFELYNKRKELLIPYWGYLHNDHRGCDYGELPEESFAIILNEAKKNKKEQEEKAKKEVGEALKKAKTKAVEQEKIRVAEQKKEDELKAKKESRNLARRKKYKEFLKEHGATNANLKTDFYQAVDGKNVTLYKKVGEFVG